MQLVLFFLCELLTYEPKIKKINTIEFALYGCELYSEAIYLIRFVFVNFSSFVVAVCMYCLLVETHCPRFPIPLEVFIIYKH